MTSTLTKNQQKTFRKDYIGDDGRPETMIVTIRHDDRCGNGHNTFSITSGTYTQDRHPGEPKITHEGGRVLWLSSCGCQHEETAKRFPELAKYIKWHLCSTNGPMYYIANTVYHASDADHNGLHKGERRHIRNGKSGLPVWRLVVRDAAGNEIEHPDGSSRWRESWAKPADPGYSIGWEPLWRQGEGKERDLDAARATAVWPDATDEELTALDLRERLEARLPALMDAFRHDVEELGFVY
jgi:hypothetical protein